MPLFLLSLVLGYFGAQEAFGMPFMKFGAVTIRMIALHAVSPANRSDPNDSTAQAAVCLIHTARQLRACSVSHAQQGIDSLMRSKVHTDRMLVIPHCVDSSSLQSSCPRIGIAPVSDVVQPVCSQRHALRRERLQLSACSWIGLSTAHYV